MNHIYKIHQRFSEYLNNSRVIENPEEFLGENYEAVLNFWSILDDLSQEQLKVVKKRYDAFFNENRSEWSKARDLAWEAAKEVVGENDVDAGSAVYNVTNSFAAFYATRELIGGVENPVFLKMFDIKTHQFPSKTLIKLAYRLNCPEIFGNPKKVLGPNWEQVLKFWLKLDELSEEQIKVVRQRYYGKNILEPNKMKEASSLAWASSKELVGLDYAHDAGLAAKDVTNTFAVCHATYELIGGVENPVFLKMFDDL